MLIRRPAVGPLTGARMPTGYRSGRKWKATRAREPPAVPAGGRRKSGAWTGKTRSNVRRRIRHRAKYGGEEAPSEGPGGSPQQVFECWRIMTSRRQPAKLDKDARVTYQPLDPGRFGFDVHTRGLPDATADAPCRATCGAPSAGPPDRWCSSHISVADTVDHRRFSVGTWLATGTPSLRSTTARSWRLNSLLNPTPTRRHERPGPRPSSPAASRTYASRWTCSPATPNWPSTAPESVW
jgi:hypothetical protein